MPNDPRKYTLTDYNKLAYEFAIRNPRVIELLSIPLNTAIVEELLTYGINATSTTFHPDEGEITFISTQELNLDYRHLSPFDHYPFSPYGEGRFTDEKTLQEINEFRGYKTLIHPLSKALMYRREDENDALFRITNLIETRGRISKLQRLMDGEPFTHYDAVVLQKQSRYSLDPTGNRKTTINDDIKFISEWIDPKKYLQLLPTYKSILQ